MYGDCTSSLASEPKYNYAKKMDEWHMYKVIVSYLESQSKERLGTNPYLFGRVDFDLSCN